jgi:hypothetical protein
MGHMVVTSVVMSVMKVMTVDAVFAYMLGGIASGGAQHATGNCASDCAYGASSATHDGSRDGASTGTGGAAQRAFAVCGDVDVIVIVANLVRGFARCASQNATSHGSNYGADGATDCAANYAARKGTSAGSCYFTQGPIAIVMPCGRLGGDRVDSVVICEIVA